MTAPAPAVAQRQQTAKYSPSLSDGTYATHESSYVVVETPSSQTETEDAVGNNSAENSAEPSPSANVGPPRDALVAPPPGDDDSLRRREASSVVSPPDSAATSTADLLRLSIIPRTSRLECSSTRRRQDPLRHFIALLPMLLRRREGNRPMRRRLEDPRSTCCQNRMDSLSSTSPQLLLAFPLERT